MKDLSVFECILAGAKVKCRGTKGNEQFRLNDIYRAAGNPSNKDPRQWLRHDDTREFTAFQAGFLNVGQEHIIESRRGRTHGGTWAHWAVAIKYAAYLDKKLEHQILRAWRGLKDEERDPTLAADRAFQRIKNHYIRHHGCSEDQAEELAAQRLLSKVNRNLLASEWSERGANAHDYPVLTNAGYLGLFNKTASELRKERNWPVKANIRDYLVLPELAQTSLLEVLARERLQEEDVRGAAEMEQVSHAIGRRLAEAVTTIRSANSETDDRPGPTHTMRTKADTCNAALSVLATAEPSLN
jgi:KilA-N domain